MTDFPPSNDPAVSPQDAVMPPTSEAEPTEPVQDAMTPTPEPAETEPSATDPIEDAIDPSLSDEQLLSEAQRPHTEELFTPAPDGASQAVAGEPPPSSPPPPPPHMHTGPPPVRRIYRSRHDSKVAGVSAGIAEYFGIDPTIARLVTLAFIISGIGIPVYIAAWIIVPMRPEGLPFHQAASPANERSMTLAFGLAALALAFGIVTGSWEVLALALIGGGIWLLSERSAVGRAGASPAPAMNTPGATASQAYQPYAHEAASSTPAGYPPAGDYSYAQAAYPPPTAAPAPKERKKQRITWIVLSLLALLAAVGIAAASGDWWDVSATRFLGIAIIIIGGGVVAGQVRNGGARGLIPLGILCALALFPVSAVDGLIDDGIGETTYRPVAIEDIQDIYSHGIGKLTVDLSELDFAGRDESVDIDLGIGELIVIVPEEAGGQAVLQAKAGEISHRLPNTDSFLFEEGVNIETGTVRLQGADGTLDLHINVGLGTAELRSESNQ